jgi:hypothetical protein
MKIHKVLIGGLAMTAAVGASLGIVAFTANAANAASPTPCTPVFAHTEYKWVPDQNGNGSTQWTTDNADPGTARLLPGKTGALVGYHRDGDKKREIEAVTCPVTEPMFNYNVNSCSVTVPYTPGLNTYLYGVPGHPQEQAIPASVTVSAGLQGATNTAAQFWIGYTVQPGYVDTNPGGGQWHIDFYNGDTIADCAS